MPELAELALTARFINSVAKKVSFNRIARSDVVKRVGRKAHPKVPLPAGFSRHGFRVRAHTRGKELQLVLKQQNARGQISPWRTGSDCGCERVVYNSDGDQEELRVTVRFGMTGRFMFTEGSELPKHAHLSMYTEDDRFALSFVDPRRFGSWALQDWQDTRSPCPVHQYQAFREYVLAAVRARPKAFAKPLCSVMLDQKWFNGIGNYLRAEILHRACLHDPFVSALRVLGPLAVGRHHGDSHKGLATPPSDEELAAFQEAKEDEESEEDTDAGNDEDTKAGESKQWGRSDMESRPQFRCMSCRDPSPVPEETPDLLSLCRDVAGEVLRIKGHPHYQPISHVPDVMAGQLGVVKVEATADEERDDDAPSAFMEWLQCYDKSRTKKKDAAGRHIYYYTPASCPIHRNNSKDCDSSEEDAGASGSATSGKKGSRAPKAKTRTAVKSRLHSQQRTKKSALSGKKGSKTAKSVTGRKRGRTRSTTEGRSSKRVQTAAPRRSVRLRKQK